MRDVTRIIAAAAVAAGLAWNDSAVARGGTGGGGYASTGPAVTVPALDPAVADHFGSAPAGPPYCATPTRTCVLHHPGYVGGPCICRVHGRRAFGNIVAQ
jgi:hypothetical protein